MLNSKNKERGTSNREQYLAINNFFTQAKWFWLLFGLGFSVFYSYLAFQQAFSSQYVIQDDARQHIFWMLRFIDRNLFPDDLIADYFQSVAPLGYTSLYSFAAFLGIDPIVMSKIVPGILGLIMTGYCFTVSLELIPIASIAFVTTLLLNQNLWLQDGLISGTPKAFITPILLAFLYYFLKNNLLGTCISIALFGLFYPSLVFICSGLLIIRLFKFKKFSLSLVNNKQDYLFSIAGLIVAFLILLPFALSTSQFGPTITVQEAKALPEFAAGQRSGFFNDNLWDFWFNASRSSLRIPSALMPPLAYLAILLPLLTRLTQTFPLSQKITSKINILIQIILVSLAMFFIAHCVLFKLHLPSRYAQHTLRVVVIFASSICFSLIINTLWKLAIDRTKKNLIKSTSAKIIITFLIGLLIFYPHFSKSFVWTRYVTGNTPELYQFLQQQPKDIIVASLAAEADNLPTFARRSILVSREYAIPYHMGYYRPFRQRAVDLIAAQYSNNLDLIKQFIIKYKIDFWLVENSSFEPQYIENDSWIEQHQPTAREAIDFLKKGETPALLTLKKTCSAFDRYDLTLISTKCILATNK
jgi:hypothetical protein